MTVLEGGNYARAGFSPVRGGRANKHTPDIPPVPVAVVALHIPAGAAERRNPLVLADVEIGPVLVRVGVFAMKRGRLVVRLPEAADRSDGVTLPPMLGEIVSRATLDATRADPAARAVLARQRPHGRRALENGADD